MDGGKKVWVPHPVEGFKLGRIVDIGSEFITIEPFDAPGTVSCYISHDTKKNNNNRQCFRLGLTQTSRYSHRSRLEA